MKSKLLIPSLLLNLVLILGLLFLIQKLGGPRYMLFKMRHQGVAGVYEHKKDLQARLSIQPDDIVFLGNSITAQGPWEEFYGDPKIKNRGIEGDVSQGIIERLPVILKSPPAKLFLLIGINDLIAHTPAHVVANYRKILDQITQKAPQTKVYIQSIYPVNNELRKSGIRNEDIISINTELLQLAQEYKMIYVDLHPILTDEEGRLKSTFSIDGIHLNGAAYMQVKEALKPYVEEDLTSE